MQRREVIAILGGAVLGWPLAGRTQPVQRRRIAIVSSVVPAELISEDSGDNLRVCSFENCGDWGTSMAAT